MKKTSPQIAVGEFHVKLLSLYLIPIPTGIFVNNMQYFWMHESIALFFSREMSHLILITLTPSMMKMIINWWTNDRLVLLLIL